MIDWGLYIINDEVGTISVNKTKDNTHLETGNIVATIKFEKGSIFNLIYTTLGNKN